MFEVGKTAAEFRDLPKVVDDRVPTTIAMRDLQRLYSSYGVSADALTAQVPAAR